MFAIRIPEAPMDLQIIDANPRKLPRQARAKATVDAILTAAAQVLVSRGYEEATTARIAEQAGVSIGSLYQYFSNKESLIAALIEQHADALVASLRDVLEYSKRPTLADSVRAAIDVTFSAHRIDPALHKILHEQVPRVGRLAKAMDAGREITEAIESCLRAHTDEIPPDHDLAITAIVVETVIDAIAHKSVLEDNGPLSGETAAREAFRLIMNYVSQPASSGRISI